MEFDELKRAWEEYERNLETGIHLNRRFLWSSILDKSETALKAQSPCEIDYSAPVAGVQKQLESRRTRKWMLRLAPPACTLLVIVGIRSLFAVTFYSALGIAVLAVAVVFGLLALAARIKRSSLVSDFDGEDMAGTAQAALLRLRRRHRVLRG